MAAAAGLLRPILASLTESELLWRATAGASRALALLHVLLDKDALKQLAHGLC